MIGQTILHYRITEKIGAGGMGEVFLARDTRLERNVAVKFLPQDMLGDPVARERFLREAKSAATLDHPHICVVHEADEVEGVPFIVMEYVEGESLKDRLARGPLPLEETLHLAAEIAEALQEAHSRHIIHRDLKPANVMLTRAGHVKVMDFGLAKRLLSSEQATTEEETLTELTQMGTTVGTLAYMSPEQLQGQSVDHRSDIFSFGAVLYEMLARTHPFRKDVGMATAAAILSKDPPPLTAHAPETPEPLVKLISDMLAKAPAQRPQSMREIHKQLRKILLEVQAPSGEADDSSLKRLARSLRRPRLAIPTAAVLIALVSFGIWFFNHRAKVIWARNIAVPEIERMVEANDVWRNLVPPYNLAVQAEAVLGNDPRLTELFSKCALNIDIRTEPSGARVYMKEYTSPDAEWIFLGVTPIKRTRVPIGIFRWKFEKEGYESVLAAASTWASVAVSSSHTNVPNNLRIVLDREGSLPSDMVRVEETETPIGKLGEFFIDRFEITNRKYKEFVDAGGYGNRAYWSHSFRKDGRELTREDAIGEFVDQTSLPGPSTWYGGDYPEGEADYPVSGISWYEAAAYAEFAGKSLPTSTHWDVARGAFTRMIQTPQLGGFALLAPFCNFQGKGPVPVGSLPGISPYGAYDMAGNVREWCWNETPEGRLVRGGAWDDSTYMFDYESQAPPFDRSAKNGFRCALYPEPETIPEAALRPLSTIAVNKPPQETEPAPDSVFQVYREQFAYDKAELNPHVEYRKESPGGWIREKISFDAAYGGERVMAYLFLPENARPPYQAVVYTPGDPCVMQRSSEGIEDYFEFFIFLSHFVKNGRAVVFPVWKGTFERGNDALAAIYTEVHTRQHTQLFIEEIKDFRRTVDYLETRPDIDSGKLAFYGMCSGAALGAIIPAIEERFKTSVLVAGGLCNLGRPEISQINYITRVRMPTLMLNGRYDSLFPLPTSSQPFFDLLGTPAELKDLKLYDTDHIPPRREFIKETLAWLDKYLGPVQR